MLGMFLTLKIWGGMFSESSFNQDSGSWAVPCGDMKALFENREDTLPF